MLNRFIAAAAVVGACSAAQAGTFGSFAYTNDAGTQISTSKDYTAKVDVHGGATVINNVTFTSGEPNVNGTITGTGFAVTGLPNHYENNSTTSLNNAVGIGSLLSNFYYGAGGSNGNTNVDPVIPPTPSTPETVTFSGLTAGVPYRAAFYISDSFCCQSETISVNDTAAPTSGSFSRAAAAGGGGAITYNYTLPVGSTSVTFTFAADASNYPDTFHQYGFSNEVVPEPASLSLLGAGALGLLARRRRHA